jgi:acyl-CoA synthetase (AMP-forming)/AMP-acid ligase II
MGNPSEVAVEMIADQRGQVLIAFVDVVKEGTTKATAPSAEPGPWELMVEVKAKLLEGASEDIPSAYIPLTNMPITTSGKLDWATLRRIGTGLSMD